MIYPNDVLHWIDDAETPSAAAAFFDKRSPLDDRLVARVARGGAADACRAVDAAAAAHEPWGRLAAPKRGEVGARVADLFEYLASYGYSATDVERHGRPVHAEGLAATTNVLFVAG